MTEENIIHNEGIKTGCQCPLSGVCNRHNVEKTPHLHKLCQTNEKYFQMWEECRGPGQRFVECKPSEGSVPQSQESRKEIVPELPSLWEQAKSFGVAATKHVLNGAQNVSEEEREKRMDICGGCEFYIKENNRCGQCGCHLGEKTKWKTSSCPIGKW